MHRALHESRPRTLLALLAACGVVVGFLARPAGAEDGEPKQPLVAASEADGPVFPVRRFHLDYLQPNPNHPPLAGFDDLQVDLSRAATGFIAPREDTGAVSLTLVELNDQPVQPMHASAIQAVLEAVRDRLTGAGLLGVYVLPDPGQIDSAGKDLRPADQPDLRIVIITGVVKRVRTVGYGERIPSRTDGPVIDHPLHARLAAGSPVQPFDPAGTQGQRDLLLKRALDDYAMLLSRHPGRQVDIAVAPAPEPAGVNLDYLVTEVKPWLVYAQLSNTGTRNTSRLREQFGFRHFVNELAGSAPGTGGAASAAPSGSAAEPAPADGNATASTSSAAGANSAGVPVSVTRIRRATALDALAQHEAIFLGESVDPATGQVTTTDRTPQVREAFGDSWSAYADAGDADAAGWVAELAAVPAPEPVLLDLIRLGRLIHAIESMGLPPIEERRAIDALLAPVTPPGMSGPQLEAAARAAADRAEVEEIPDRPDPQPLADEQAV